MVITDKKRYGNMLLYSPFIKRELPLIGKGDDKYTAYCPHGHTKDISKDDVKKEMYCDECHITPPVAHPRIMKSRSKRDVPDISPSERKKLMKVRKRYVNLSPMMKTISFKPNLDGEVLRSCFRCPNCDTKWTDFEEFDKKNFRRKFGKTIQGFRRGRLTDSWKCRMCGSEFLAEYEIVSLTLLEVGKSKSH